MTPPEPPEPGDRPDWLAAIRARLNAATPGLWKMFDGWGPLQEDGLHRALRIGTDDYSVFTARGPDGLLCDIAGREEDFEFIAHARMDMVDLLFEVSRLTRENAGLTVERDNWQQEFDRMVEAYESLLGENAGLREAQIVLEVIARRRCEKLIVLGSTLPPGVGVTYICRDDPCSVCVARSALGSSTGGTNE